MHDVMSVALVCFPSLCFPLLANCFFFHTPTNRHVKSIPLQQFLALHSTSFPYDSVDLRVCSVLTEYIGQWLCVQVWMEESVNRETRHAILDVVEDAKQEGRKERREHLCSKLRSLTCVQIAWRLGHVWIRDDSTNNSFTPNKNPKIPNIFLYPCHLQCSLENVTGNWHLRSCNCFFSPQIAGGQGQVSHFVELLVWAPVASVVEGSEHHVEAESNIQLHCKLYPEANNVHHTNSNETNNNGSAREQQQTALHQLSLPTVQLNNSFHFTPVKISFISAGGGWQSAVHLVSQRPAVDSRRQIVGRIGVGVRLPGRRCGIQCWQKRLDVMD